MNRRRLDAEELRDAMLLVSGQLDRTVGGPMLRPEANYERVADLNRKKGGGPINQAFASTRRSLYLPVIRSGLYEVFQVFDAADPSVVTGRRETTTVAPQSLFLMNSELVWQASRQLAERLLDQSPDHRHDGTRFRQAYELAYARRPSSDEIARALRFIAEYEQELADDDVLPKARRLDAWQAWCRVVLGSTEFIYVE
jgi:hypothetical protein